MNNGRRALPSLIATGQLDEAEQRLGTTLEATRTYGMPHWEGLTLKARAQLHTARGDEDAARNDLDAAIEIFERLESRLELALTLVLRGDDDDVTRARDLFQSSGAPTDEAPLSSIEALRGRSGSIDIAAARRVFAGLAVEHLDHRIADFARFIQKHPSLVSRWIETPSTTDRNPELVKRILQLAAADLQFGSPES